MSIKHYPNVVIVGRPNVGKSSLFNRIIGRRAAIVMRESGTTRDRLCMQSVWNHRHFMLYDTGGMSLMHDETGDLSSFDVRIREQLFAAFEDADAIIFVVDGMQGRTSMDDEVATFINGTRFRDKTVLAVNKCDNDTIEHNLYDFSVMGFKQMVPISCEHNRNIDDLLDMVVADFEDKTVPESADLKVAIVGRPNVGKSSVTNRLLGDERVIVSDEPGTTRDAVDVSFTVTNDEEEIHVQLIDTAGIRSKRKHKTVVETFSVMRAEIAIRRADIVLVVMDASEQITTQDKKICDTVIKNGKACVLLVNKWDLVKDRIKKKDFEEGFRNSLRFMDFAPVIFCSALQGTKLSGIIPVLIKIRSDISTHLPTPLVNEFFKDISSRYPPPSSGGRTFKIYYATMPEISPPVFTLFVNDKKLCPSSYLSFIRNRLYSTFGFTGQPIQLVMRNKERE
ncbi:MAG: ribosome biogenesis GTPase Der [Verrucomicrobiota bacterium]|nr:ribosome biogenesis GTPase Der [Verrucomicrobiota bacterium]